MTTDSLADRATIVVTPRERFGLTDLSLESIYAHTPAPNLVYVDGNAPKAIGRSLVEAAERHGFDLISADHHLSPNIARNMGFERVETEYVVFVDNDLIVTPGWLDRLVECADTTGAAAVGPLYFEGDPVERIVHMAGGDYELSGDHGTRSFSTSHRHQGTCLDDLAAPLVREPVDFVEFHCMLVRSDVLRQLGGLDPRLFSTREHLDLCLMIHEVGGIVMFEPASEVTYRTPPPIDRGDVVFFLRRWSERWNRASLEHFCQKHGIDPAYTRRVVALRGRRQLFIEPVQRVARRLPQPVGRFVTRVIARLEREINGALFRLPDVTDSTPR